MAGKTPSAAPTGKSNTAPTSGARNLSSSHSLKRCSDGGCDARQPRGLRFGSEVDQRWRRPELSGRARTLTAVPRGSQRRLVPYDHCLRSFGCCREMTKFLLDSKALPNLATASGDTPLMAACAKGRQSTLQELLKQKVSFDLSVIEQLVPQADHTLRNSKGERAIDMAERNGHFMATMFMKNFASSVRFVCLRSLNLILAARNVCARSQHVRKLERGPRNARPACCSFLQKRSLHCFVFFVC